MKPKKAFAMFLLVALVVGGSIAAVTQSGMDEMMQMMREKMMNRPEAMKTADQAIQDQKAAAMRAGTYNCCLKNSCDYCALKMGECPCGMNAANDMPVCNECKGSWYAGDGSIPGKTPDQIKTMPRGM